MTKRTKFLRLAESPELVMEISCSVCLVECDWDDGFYCPSCGTVWSEKSADGDTGYLAEKTWDTDDIEDTVTTVEEAWRRGREIKG